jgi:hypothetical protein
MSLFIRTTICCRTWVCPEHMVNWVYSKLPGGATSSFIKLAFAYEATTQCSRTDRKPRSAHVTVMSALGAALAATALPPAPRGALVPLVLFAFFRAPRCSSLAFRLPARSLGASVFRPRLLLFLFLSCCPSYCSSCCILPHPLFAPLVGPAAAAAPTAPAAPVAPPVATVAAAAAVTVAAASAAAAEQVASRRSALTGGRRASSGAGARPRGWQVGRRCWARLGCK